MDTIKRRQDFQAAARARSWATRGVVIQACERGDEDPPRIGFTVTKKLGNAVHRNRIRRRLRAAVRQLEAGRLSSGCDYVLIGRRDTAHRPFENLVGDIDLALEHLNKGEAQAPRRGKRGRRGANSG